MLRWLLVCALVAQTLAASRHSRHASWPAWMKMPQMQWPDWMPTQQDLPQIDLSQIDLPEMPKLPSVDIPDIQIPEISMPDVELPKINLPDIFTGRGSSRTGQSQRANQRQQYSPRNDQRQGSQRWGQPDRDVQQPPVRTRKGRKGQSEHELPQPVTARNPSQSRQGQGQSDARRPSSYGRRPSESRRLPSNQGVVIGFPEDRQGGRQDVRPGKLRKGYFEIDTQPVSVQGWPSGTRGNKGRKSTPQHQEGPPQRREPVAPNQRRTRQRSEPSVRQQVEDFRSGMPRWLRTELNETFSTMKHEIEEGRLRMSSWADEISGAAQEWWNEWRGRGDRNTPSRDRSPSGGPRREQSRRPSANQNSRGRGQGNGWGNDRTNGWGNGRQTGWDTDLTNGWSMDRQGNPLWNEPRRGQSNRRPGHGFSNGRGDTFSNGRGQNIGNGRGHSGARRWWEGTGNRENSTWCKRPFRPTSSRPSKEEPFFEVLCGGNDYEARLYNSSVWVSVTVKSLTYDLAVHKAYMKLYRYINGHNSNGTEIMRTVPIHTKVKANSRDNRWFECHNYTISFFLPKEVHLDPPTPNDPQLFIEYEGPTVYYAHAFRGFAMEFNIFEYMNELTNTLDLNQEAYLMEDFIVNVYDAPWRFFNRRNDILVAMDTEILETPRCAVPEPQSPTTMIPEVTTAPVEASTASTARPATEAITVPVQPTVLGEVPAEIKLPGGMKNPFDNNDLEQEQGPDCVPGVECPRYDTAVNYDRFEQRHYAYSRWICIDQAACDFERAQWLTQGPLLEYFYPKGNREQTTMTPTTPLVIGMDVSDLNRTDCGVTYTSCLFIPEEHQGAPPTPRDARLYIQDIPAMSRYVLPFGGFATSQNVPKLSVEFIMKLEQSKLPYDGSLIAVAQYTTSKLDKTRINEVWIMDQSLIQGNIGLE